MDQIKELLTNAGFIVNRIDDQYIYFQDPSCIFTAFDTFLDYAWILIFVLTAIMLFGWGLLYIKNGVKFDSLSNNVKSLLLIFGVLSVIKPAINLIYGDDLFGKLCDTRRVSMVEVQELLNLQNNQLHNNCQECINNIPNVNSVPETIPVSAP